MKFLKKHIFLSLFIILFSICLTTKYLTSSESKTSFDFNYLNNNKVVSNTKTLLLNNNIPKENINLWLDYVKKYNLKSKSFIQKTCDGWININLNRYNKINFAENLNGWTEEDDSLDLNCRISAFMLMKDMISSESFTKKHDPTIEKEIQRISTVFKDNFTDKNATTFRSLFTPIELDIYDFKKPNVYDETLKTLKDIWKKENLIFKNSTPSLIQAVLIEPNDTKVLATPGHAGLLVEDSNILYFIEKKNPCFPYQVSRFQNYNDLNQYILTQFKDIKNCKLMILQNDELIFKYDI